MRSDAAGQESTPLSGRIRLLAASVLDLAETRMQLMGTEAEIQLGRLVAIGVLAVVAVLLLTLALAFGSALIVAAFWDTHRLAALAVVAAIHLLAALGCLVALRSRLRDGPRAFEGTIGEFRRDIERLRAQRP